MMKTPAALLAALLLLVAAPVAAADEYERLPSPSWLEDERDPLIYVWPELRFLGTKTSVDTSEPFVNDQAVVRLLGDEIEAAGGKLDIDTLGLRVRGPEAARDLARRRVLALGEWLAGRAEVSVTVAHLPAPPDTADAARSTLRKGEGKLVFHARLETRRGGTSVAEETNTRTLVAAMDVEVAQDSSIGAPVSARLVTGNRVGVHCRPVTGDRAVAALSLHLAAEPEVEEVRTSTGTLHLPEVPFLSLFCALGLRRGAAELLLLEHPWEDGYLAVLVELHSLPALPEVPAGLLDLAALVGWPDANEAWMPTGTIVKGTVSEKTLPRRLGRKAGYHLSGRLEDYLQEGAVAHPFSLNLVAVSGEPASAAAKADTLRNTVLGSKVDFRKSVLELPWDQLQKAPWFDPATGEVDLKKSALAGWRQDLRIPHLATTPLLLVRGVMRRFLALEEVEIAQSSAIFQPVVGTHVEGESLRVTEVPGGGGLAVEQSTSDLLGVERRELSIRKDILGRRQAEKDHIVDLLETRETYRRPILGAKPKVTIRRAGDQAVVTVWSK